MRSVLFGLAGGAVIVALTGDALASPPLANTCYDVGFACLNAGPDGNQPGTCMAATCVDILDASFACGVCEPADAGASDGGTHGSNTDAGSSDASAADSEAAGVDAAVGDAAAADAEPMEGDSSTGTDEAGGGVFSGSEAGSSSSGDEPDAGPQAAPTMPGCTAAPSSRNGSTGFALLVLSMAGVARMRRRRT